MHYALTGKTAHIFDLEKPPELGAFLNLAQHHGFPTPLLDWTYSPFVAAWFAFTDAKKAASASIDQPSHIRVFRFDRLGFSKYNQFQSLLFAPPHFSILETLAISNDRAIPQQGLLTLTNLQDIEGYIFSLEEQGGHELIGAYDIPFSEVDSALDDLALMGITRSSLMPSLESICLDIRDRRFK